MEPLVIVRVDDDKMQVPSQEETDTREKQIRSRKRGEKGFYEDGAQAHRHKNPRIGKSRRPGHEIPGKKWKAKISIVSSVSGDPEVNRLRKSSDIALERNYNAVIRGISKRFAREGRQR